MTMQATKRPTAASDRAGRARGVLTTVIKSRTTPIFGVLLVLFAVFSVLKPNAFPQLANAQNMLSDAAILLVLAVGSTYVILTAGIDLSVNGVLVFSGVIAAKTLGAVGGSGMGTLLLGLLVSLLAGLAWGLLNGFLVAVAKVPALIVTLGTLGMSLGAALLITKGIDVTDIPINLTTGLGAGRIWGVPWLAVVALIVALIGGITLSQTRFGRYTYAAGSQAEALRRSGVSTARHLVEVDRRHRGKLSAGGQEGLLHPRCGGRQLLHHDAVRRGGGGEEVRTVGQHSGPDPVRPVPTDPSRQRGSGQQARRDADRTHFVPLLQAKNAGVKVGLVDTTLNNTSVAVTSVSTDNAAGGAAAADALAKLIGEKGTVLVIAFKNGVSTSDQRTQGFIDAIKKHPNIKLLPTQSADKTPAKATTIVNGTLSEHPDLVGIFATNQDVASGAATAIRQVNKQGQIKIVGFDAGPVQVKALQDGSVQALIAQMPYQIGVQAVDQIAAALKGQTPKTHVGTQVFTLTKDNMSTPDGQNAVYKTSC